jgi:hypothetical protein
MRCTSSFRGINQSCSNHSGVPIILLFHNMIINLKTTWWGMGSTSIYLSDHLTDEAESLAGGDQRLLAAAAAGQLAVHRPQRVRELRHLAQVRELGVFQHEFCATIFFQR